MNIKSMMNTAQRGLITFGKSCNRHLPDILAGLGVVGIGATVWLAMDAGWKLNQMAQEEDTFAGVNHTAMDKIKIIAKPVTAGVATAVCFTAGNRIQAHRLDILGKEYNRVVSDLRSYQSAVIGAVGAEVHHKALSAAAADEKPKSISHDPEKFTFYDTYTRQEFVATLPEVIEMQSEFNRRLVRDGGMGLTHYCDMMGMCSNGIDTHIGWDASEMWDFYGEAYVEFWNEPVDEPDGSRWYKIHFFSYPTVDGIINPDTYIEPDIPFYEHLDSLESQNLQVCK